MRIACVYVPQLALQAILRRDPERREAAVALADGTSERARVLACSLIARKAGVRPGLTVSQARAVASERLASPNGASEALRVVPVSPADTAAATAALADVGYAFAPQVEVESEGERLYLDAGELGQMFPQGERAVAQSIAAQAARVGLAVQVAIASSKPVARVAAQSSTIAVVPAGLAQARAFLAAIPMRTALAAGAPAALQGEIEELTARLARWGASTLGAVATLPVAEVTVRLGRAGAWLHALACGTAEEPFAPRLPPDALEEGTELEYPLAELEPVSFVLRGLLDRALQRLSCRGLACVGLGLRLKLDPQGFDVREIPLGAPTREVATLLQLVRLDLARRPPAAPIVGISALVLPARVRASQLDLWRPAGPAPERMAATLARLEALVGPENVGAPAQVESFREEAFSLRRYQPAAETTKQRPPRPLPPPQGILGFRRFRPPQPLEVLMDRDGPSALRGQRLVVRVMIAAGPYRAEGAWWSEESFSRDYWDVHASDGAVYRMHQERQSGSWFLDGYYD